MRPMEVSGAPKLLAATTAPPPTPAEERVGSAPIGARLAAKPSAPPPGKAGEPLAAAAEAAPPIPDAQPASSAAAAAPPVTQEAQGAAQPPPRPAAAPAPAAAAAAAPSAKREGGGWFARRAAPRPALLSSRAPDAPAVTAALASSGAPAPAPAAPRTCAARALALCQGYTGQASLVYLAYTAIILYIDLKAQPDASRLINSTGTGEGGDDYLLPYVDDPYQVAVRQVHQLYLIAAILHVLNALQWACVWLPLINPLTGELWGLLDWVQVPELLNLGEALLYTASAVLYSQQQVVGPGRYLDSTSLLVHKLEFAASLVQLGAAGCWCVVWWHTHERGPGRGLTLDDPEPWALLLVVAPSFLYVAYSARVMTDPQAYISGAFSQLYTVGNMLFFAGAVFYVLVALRDEGFFTSFGLFQLLRARRAALPLSSKPAHTAALPRVNPLAEKAQAAAPQPAAPAAAPGAAQAAELPVLAPEALALAVGAAGAQDTSAAAASGGGGALPPPPPPPQPQPPSLPPPPVAGAAAQQAPPPLAPPSNPPSATPSTPSAPLAAPRKAGGLGGFFSMANPMQKKAGK